MRFQRYTICITVVLFFLAVGGSVSGGSWYQSDEEDYWWFVDGSPEYEVKLPSTAYNYMESVWGGASRLQVTLADTGLPHIFVGHIPKAEPKTLFQSLTAPWALSFESARTIEDRDITTDRGLTARFMAMTGSGKQSLDGVIRMVAFTKDDSTAYLLFVGEMEDYVGRNRQQWLKAVHSFSWT